MRPGRRNALKLLSSGFALASLRLAGAETSREVANDRTAADGTLALIFDGNLHTSVLLRGKPITPFQASEALILEDRAIEKFAFRTHTHEDLQDPRHGAGRRHVVSGISQDGIEKRVEVTFFEELAGFAVLQVRYRNNGTNVLKISGWRNAAHQLADTPGGFWSFSGATHEDRRDWVQPLAAGFD